VGVGLGDPGFDDEIWPQPLITNAVISVSTNNKGRQSL
jgi:hypothetical protein